MRKTKALHHITAVTSDAQTNVDFYEGVLGQRLVKTTVNFDDPGTHHFYYGDEVGTPGTVMTFFPWLHMGRGQPGNGEAGAVTYGAPADSLEFWAERLDASGVSVQGVEERFGEKVLLFADPDGLSLGIVATGDSAVPRQWQGGPIPKEYALLGFHSVTLWLSTIEPTSALLRESLGYEFEARAGNRYRFRADSDCVARYIDLEHRPAGAQGVLGAGSIHHIAFRSADDEELLQYRQQLTEAGEVVTRVQDRKYFRSIYFREPGGVLFEVATDAPGFLYDEPVESLGDALKLPEWLEPRRERIHRGLPHFERRAVTAARSTT